MKFSGRIGDFSLPDILRILVQSQKTGYLSIVFKGQESRIYLAQGQLRHAYSEGRSGESAVFNVLTFDADAEFDFVEGAEIQEHTLQSDLDTLIQNGIAYLETWRKVMRQYPAYSGNTEVFLRSGANLSVATEEQNKILVLLSASPQQSLRMHALIERLAVDVLGLIEQLEALVDAGYIHIIGEERHELKRFFSEIANTLYFEFESISGIKLKQDISRRLQAFMADNNMNIQLQNGQVVEDNTRSETIEEQKTLYGLYLNQLIHLIAPIYGNSFIHQAMAKVLKQFPETSKKWVDELKLEIE